MRLEMGTFPVTDIVFGRTTRYDAGRLTVDREAVLEAVRQDPRIASAGLEIAKPGESVRIWPVRDVIEPRVKVEGPGVCYPGICGREIATVGDGRTHRLAGMGVVEVSSVNWHDAGGDFVETYLDMSGHYGEMYPYQKLLNLCLVVEPDSSLNEEVKNYAVHKAALTVADQLGEAVRALTPPEREVFELTPVDPELPKVVYIWCVHSPQAMSASPSAFCTATYGLTQLTPPWYLHPNEILDGALTGPYRTAFAMSWTVANNPLFLDLYRRHGRDWNFLGVISLRTEWTTQTEKQLMANQTAKLAQPARRAGRRGHVGRGRQRVHRGGAQHPGVRAPRHQDRVPHQRGRRDRRRAHHARAPARGRRDREHELLQERHPGRARSARGLARDRRAHEDRAAGLDHRASWRRGRRRAADGGAAPAAVAVRRPLWLQQLELHRVDGPRAPLT